MPRIPSILRSRSSTALDRPVRISKSYARERKQANDLYEFLEEPAQKFLNQAASEKRGNLRRQNKSLTLREIISVITLKDVLRDYCGLFKQFCDFAKKINADESLNFLLAITSWRRNFAICSMKANVETARAIFEKFIGQDASEPINIDHELMSDLTKALAGDSVSASVWSSAQTAILRILETDTVSKFLADPIFTTWKEKEVKKREKAYEKGEVPPWIAFTSAIREGQGVDALKVLISQGATSRDEDEETLLSGLHLAAKRTDPQTADVISFLLSMNANVNALDCQGWTPFHAAAEAGNLLACKLLIATGRANLTAPTSRNRNFAHNLLVLNEYSEDQLPVLKEILITIIETNPKENILNIKNLKGETSLHYLTRNSYRCAVNIGHMLLELGASPNIKNRRGYSPLHTAIIQEHQELVRLFVKHGADVQLKCRGKTGQELSCSELISLNPRLSTLTELFPAPVTPENKEKELNNMEHNKNNDLHGICSTESSEVTRHDDEPSSDEED